MSITDLPQQRLSRTTGSEDFLRVMVFAISGTDETNTDRLFALPLEAIVKIVNCPPDLGNFSQGIGIATLEGQMTTVVDLAYRVAPDRPTTAADRKFLILLQTETQEPCAIPVATFPTLLDLPLTAVRAIPALYRQVNEINFASHMATVDRADGRSPLQIFLMGMTHILADKLAAAIDRRDMAALN
jgi:chemotaxis signal transduction protein